MDNLKQLEKLVKVFNTDNIVTPDQIEEVLLAMVTILANNKKSVDFLNEETKATVESVLSKSQAEYAKHKADLEERLMSSTIDVHGRVGKKMMDMEARLTMEADQKMVQTMESCQKMMDECKAMMPKDGMDGKDGSPDTAPQIKDKLESLEGDARLDAKAIKNLPQATHTTQTIYKGGGGIRLNVGGVEEVHKLNVVGGTVTGSDHEATLTVTGAGATAFTDLTDVPAAYTGQGGKVVAVKADVSGLEFITASSTDEKVKYDAGDPTAGYVADKFVAGTGISVTEGTGGDANKLQITNSAPDQTVSITAGTNIDSVTGTYPNFTVNAATQGGSYTLPTASDTVKGGVKIGARLTMTGEVLSADQQGTVTAVSVATANGVSGSSSGGATPALTISLGAITPSTVNALTLASQTVGFTVAGGTTSKTLTVPLDASVSGTNTGDQTLAGLGGLALDQATPQTIINGQPIQDTLTASQITATDANKKLQSLTTATYPSLTELSYVKGTTSAIQTQFTNKLDKQFSVDINRQGFLNTTETSISFTGTTFTLTDAGSGWSYYRAGLKYTISGNKTVNLSAGTAGIYYIYIDATDGTLTCSAVNAAWSLLDTKVPVATVAYNSTLTPTYWLADERHTALIDQRMEYYLHTLDGARLVSAPTLSGYTINSDVNANKTFAISASSLLDQDLKFDPAALTQPNGTNADYVVWYRTGASTWVWKSSNMPFVYNVGNTNNWIQWDNGGTMTDATGGAGGNVRFVNSYLLITNKTGAARHIIVPGRAIYTTLATAQNEAIANFTWNGFEIDEAIICYRLTWTTVTSTSQGKCQLAATPQVLNLSTVTNVSSGAGTDHNTLSNLQGGTTSEYYHLTSAQATVVGNTSGTNTGDNSANTNAGLVHTAGAESITGAKTFDKDTILTKGTSTGVTTISTANTSGTSYTQTLPAQNGTIANVTGTSDAITVGTIELGAATDTTLSRTGAGVIAVEGARVITSAGTTSGTILKNNGTTFVASTETYAAPGASGQVLTSDGTNWTSAAPAGGGGGLWTAVAGSPTRASNTTFTVTDTSNANKYDLVYSRGTPLKWTESSTVKQAVVVNSAYATNTVTVTIMGDTMASIDASSLKYAHEKARVISFAVAGTIATGTDLSSHYNCPMALKVYGADGYHGTAGTTNATTYDINKNGTTMFTAKVSIASGATASDVTVGSTADSGTVTAVSDVLSIDCDSVSTTAPIDAYINLFVFPLQNQYLS